MSAIAIELAAAYVSIVPSLKGAAGEISKQLGDVDTSAIGSRMGEQMSKSVGGSLDFSAVGKRLQDAGKSISKVGGSLTRHITVPAAGAAAAVAGITAALGWGRLVSLDTAQAQLRGLGYEGQDVERIMAQVTDAVQGGMTTLAEGTAIAAGALAAGVEEGAELERYIRLVGDAATGANRPVAEMAQIFNRVQGQGKLMTQELNMIEQGLPGFAATMAETMGVTQAEFRKMVTAGEVSAEQFLDVMDDFAGGMAAAYADSWEGLVANTKAWVGIIGESILRGAFQEAKGELASFQEWLQTDEVQQWAEDAGAAVSRAFSKIVESVRDAIDWWNELSDVQQDVFKVLGGIAVAAGPILVVVGRVVSIIGGLLRAIGGIRRLALILPLGKIGLIAGAIAAVAGALSWFFTETELGQEIWSTAWQAIQDTATEVGLWLQNSFVPAVQAAWEGVVAAAQAAADWYEEHLAPVFSALGDLLGEIWNQLWQSLSETFGGIVEAASAVWADIQAAWALVGPAVMASVEATFAGMAAGIEFAFSSALAVVEGALGVLEGLISATTAAMRGDWDGMWSSLGDAVQSGLGIVPGIVGATMTSIDNIMRAALGNLYGAWAAGWQMLLGTLSASMSAVVTVVGRGMTLMVIEAAKGIASVVATVATLPTRARNALAHIGNALVGAGRALIQGFIDGIRMSFTGVRVALQSLTSQLPDWKGPAPRDRTILFGAGQLVIGGFVDGLESQYGAVRSTLGDLTNMLEAYEVPGLSVDDLMGEIDTFLREVSNPEGVGVSARATRAAAQPAAAPGGMSRDDMADAMRAALRGMFDNANIRLTGTEHLADGVAAVLELERSTV